MYVGVNLPYSDHIQSPNYPAVRILRYWSQRMVTVYTDFILRLF